MAEYRPIEPADHSEYRRFTRYAFAAEQGPLEPDREDGYETDLFELRGLYDDELKSGCKRYRFTAYVRDGTEPVGGLGALATPPEHRRQGYARELCRAVCREYATDGVGLVVLWPFSTPFYRRLGWATAHDRYEFRLPVMTLPAHDQQGEYRRLAAEDWERLRPVEAATGEGVTLSMRRSESWWRERTLTAWTGGTDPFVYGYERNGGLAGYLVYTVDDSRDTSERTLSVSASGWVDEEAHRSLLEFLRRHGAQIDVVELQRSTDSRLLDLVENPDRATCERVPGPMARLTTLDPLGELDWSPDEPLTMSVTDPLLSETNRTVRVSADGLERHADADPDVRVDVGTLTQLYLGRHDPVTAERVGGLVLTTPERRDSLAAVFPQRPVCLHEFF